jgi:hypothetical protein
LGDWGYDYFSLTSNASPNDIGIVIVVIIVGEGQVGLHGGGIIAWTMDVQYKFLKM